MDTTERLRDFRRISPFERIWAAFLLVLIAATWPLWFPWGLGAQWLGVPMWTPLTSLPWWGIAAPSITLVVALIGVLASGFMHPKRARQQRISRAKLLWFAVAFSLAIGFIVDQHRLQPWAYQSAIYAVVFACVPAARLRYYLWLPAASVYLYSALGKFDYQFTHTVGQEFLQTLTGILSVDIDTWPMERRVKLALLFPAAELMLGVGLLFKLSRRWAGIGIIAMHLSLLLLLGPWGLGHSRGVLLWNGLLCVQAYWLFVRWPPRSTANLHAHHGPEEARPPMPVAAAVQTLIALMLLAPLFERTGYWDHWLSWSLYSPHTSRVDIQLHQSAARKLPDPLPRYLEPDRDGDSWRTMDLASWSLQQRYVPIYPQARYQLAVAARLAARCDIEQGIRLRVRGVSDRWSGRRDERQRIGRRQLDQQLQEYWLVPRP